MNGRPLREECGVAALGLGRVREPQHAVHRQRGLAFDDPQDVLGVKLPAADDALEGVYLYGVLDGCALGMGGRITGDGGTQGRIGEQGVYYGEEDHDDGDDPYKETRLREMEHP